MGDSFLFEFCFNSKETAFSEIRIRKEDAIYFPRAIGRDISEVLSGTRPEKKRGSYVELKRNPE